MSPENIQQAKSASLVEYQALRAELNLYLSRVDRIIAAYIAVVSAVMAFLVRPSSGFDFELYVQTEVLGSNFRSGVFMVLSIVNSALLLRILHYYATIMAIAEYTDRKIADEFHDYGGRKVLLWDSRKSSLKTGMVVIGALSQAVFVALALAISILILYFVHQVRTDHAILSWLYAAAVAFFGLTIVLFVFQFAVVVRTWLRR